MDIKILETTKLACDDCKNPAVFSVKTARTNPSQSEDAELYLCKECAKLLWQKLVSVL